MKAIRFLILKSKDLQGEIVEEGMVMFMFYISLLTKFARAGIDQNGRSLTL